MRDIRTTPLRLSFLIGACLFCLPPDASGQDGAPPAGLPQPPSGYELPPPSHERVYPPPRRDQLNVPPDPHPSSPSRP